MKKFLICAVIAIVFTEGYVFSYESKIDVWLSNSNIFYNNEKIEFADANGNFCDSFIYNGITYVPLRSMVETMGKSVSWIGEERKVYITDGESNLRAEPKKSLQEKYGEYNITVWLADMSIFYNGKEIKFTDANGKACDSFIYNGITYVPLRSMAETMGYDVYWNEEKKQVVIEYDDVIEKINIAMPPYDVCVLKQETNERMMVYRRPSAYSSFRSIDKKFNTNKTRQTMLIDCFSPIPVINVCTVYPYSAEVCQATMENHEATIKLYYLNEKVKEYVISIKRTNVRDFFERAGGGLYKDVSVLDESNEIFVYWYDVFESEEFRFLKDENGQWHENMFMSSKNTGKSTIINSDCFINEPNFEIDYDLTLEF